MKKYLFLIFAVSVLIITGCRSEEEKTNIAVNTATVNAPVNSTVAEAEPEVNVNAPFVPSADPKDDLLDAMRRLQSTDSRYVKLSSSAMPGMNTEVEFIKPDRIRIKSAANETVGIGSDTFVKKNGKWEKSDENLVSVLNEMKKDFNADKLNAIKNIKKTDTEKINGKAATVYTYTNDASDTMAAGFTKVWIASDNGLPLKIVVESGTGENKQIITTEYSYDKPIKIEAPQID